MGGFKPQGSQNIGATIGANILRDNIGGVLTTQPTAKYASGARCIIRINGKPLAFAFQVSWKIETAQTEIRTIDDYLPYEFAPKLISVEGSLSGWHIPGEGASAMLLQSDALSFLFHRYIQIEVRDSATDALLFFTNKAVIVSRSEDFKTGSLANVTLSWKAIGWKDERNPDFPEAYNGVTAAAEKEQTRLQQNLNKLPIQTPPSIPTPKIVFA